MRIIAKLDVKPPYVIKPVHFEGLRKIGKSVELVQKYYQQGADEIVYIDIVASLYQREILLNDIKAAANQLFVPFCVGGGVRSIEDFSILFHNGADKVTLNTHAVQENPQLIDDAAKIFGSQAVVINIEAKRTQENYNDTHWNCYTDCGRISSNKNALSWASEVQERGAGEIILQSVDKDGRQQGFDNQLIENVISTINIPVVVASGSGSLKDIVDVATTYNPSGIAVSSLLHYNRLTILEIKQALADKGIEVSL